MLLKVLNQGTFVALWTRTSSIDLHISHSIFRISLSFSLTPRRSFQIGEVYKCKGRMIFWPSRYTFKKKLSKILASGIICKYSKPRFEELQEHPQWSLFTNLSTQFLKDCVNPCPYLSYPSQGSHTLLNHHKLTLLINSNFRQREHTLESSTYIAIHNL